MIQTFFPNHDAVLEDDNAPIHTAGTVPSWFEGHMKVNVIFPDQHNHQIQL
jgi:hypothetical protein